jgi:hypothetical protein
MNAGLSWFQLAERAKNFYGEYEPFLEWASYIQPLLTKLCEAVESILDDSDLLCAGSEKLLLDKTFSKIYDLLFEYIGRDVEMFGKVSPLYKNVFEACYFSSLSTFIHHSKRIDGMSISKIVDNSGKYPKEKFPKTPHTAYEPRESEILKLRKKRTRLLSNNAVYIKREEWSAMTKDAEYEWGLYYFIESLSDEMRDTFKRLGNLNKDIQAVVTPREDEGYQKRLEVACNKLAAKVNKISYGNFLELNKLLQTYIYKNKQYYGMNFYRYERRLAFSIIKNETDSLLACNRGLDEIDVFTRIRLLQYIDFPRIYQDLSKLNNFGYMGYCSRTFVVLLRDVMTVSRLVIDYLVENGHLGNDWEQLLLDTINEMTESVFYAPSEIDWNVASDSQEKFQKVLLALNTP